MLKPADLCRIMAGVEQKPIQIKLDRMDCDHTKRCPRFRLSRPSILKEEQCCHPVLIGKQNDLCGSCGFARISRSSLFIHSAQNIIDFANEY